MAYRVLLGPLYSRFRDLLPVTICGVLAAEMSIDVEAARHMRRSSQRLKHWSGKTNFFNKNLQTFLTGHLEWVASILDRYGIKLEIIDYELPTLHPHTVKLKARYELRDYQEEIVDEMLEKRRGIVRAAINSGKTIMAWETIRVLRLRTLYLVPTKELFKQAHAELTEMIPDLPVGQIKAGTFAPGLVTIAMTQSILSRLNRKRRESSELRENMLDWLGNVECVIGDEVHKDASIKWSQIFKLCRNAQYRYGLSATPISGTSSKDLLLEGITGPIFSRTIKTPELVERGLSTPTTVFFVEYNPPALLPPKGGEENSENDFSWHEVYQLGIKQNATRAGVVADIIKREMKEGRRVAVFVDTIKHGNFIEKFIPHKILTQTMYGHDVDKVRELKLLRFKGGDWPVLITTLLREGYNLKEMDTLIIAGGLKSYIGVIQRAGRVVRTREGKAEARIYDFIDTHHPFLFKHTELRYEAYRSEGFDLDHLDLT